MKLTIIQVGESPPALAGEFGRYPPQFQDMFTAAGEYFTFETVFILDGAPFPDLEALEGLVITGSAAGVYDTPSWIDPLRTFIRQTYAQKIPTLGICFGHQIMADALGGDVRKSEKGWGLGRHVYEVKANPDFMNGTTEIAIAASHQDQVITPPEGAQVFLASEFTPNAGLIYENGSAISLQPHPEFDLGYSRALVELRRGNPLNDGEVTEVDKTLDTPVDNAEMAKHLARFFKSQA